MDVLVLAAETGSIDASTVGGAISALLTLTLMEIVLGIDNIVFLSILAGRLPPEQARKARQVGLLLAMVARIVLLLFASWLASLKTTAFTVFEHAVSWRDMVMLAGGLFLVYKATHEIHKKLETPSHGVPEPVKGGFGSVLMQIVVMDLVFSIDSVITAVGMAGDTLWVMIVAVVLSIIVMLAAAGRISAFVDKHPTVKMLALSFLILIGVMLIADGLGRHIPRGYIYFAMAFSLGVEVLNLVASGRRARRAAGEVAPRAH